MTFSDRLKHFWHVVSNIRPIYWISLYIALVPIFALFYWCVPIGQFRIPDGGTADYGGWLYYSIVTITTLGFGDYTPMGPAAQCITAVEVMCGLIIIGFFLNAVGSMKSEIDVESEIERQKKVHIASEKEKLIKNTPVFFHKLNQFLSYCYAVTTPITKRKQSKSYNPEFTSDDMADMHKPSELPGDLSKRSAVESLMKCASSLSLFMDSIQSRIDLSIWPQLLDDCFAFVADYQMLTPVEKDTAPNDELMHFIRTSAALARNIETQLTEISSIDTTTE
ncbi:MAG: potassium channel family protein [Muribaculaceae bacterium]|nr:potassium channel family protein [Muribaculaceae bacterium]